VIGLAGVQALSEPERQRGHLTRSGNVDAKKRRAIPAQKTARETQRVSRAVFCCAGVARRFPITSNQQLVANVPAPAI
jgi:hypothetical protein